MRICLMLAAILALISAASADDYGHPTAFVVSPIHEAQIVRAGDDGMDHVEYDLLIVSVLPEPATLSSVTVLDPAGKELMRIERAALAAVTQPLFAGTPRPSKFRHRPPWRSRSDQFCRPKPLRNGSRTGSHTRSKRDQCLPRCTTT